MTATTRVNLHCHSNCSDGALPPEEVARRLAEAGVVFAALTDHDTTDGLPRFQAALQRRGIGSVSGVELTAVWQGGEVHLLVYGFDPAHAEWLKALRGSQPNRPAASLPVAEAIALAHRAGGHAFLAHPLFLRADHAALREILVELKACGLDGIEALYAPTAPADRAALVEMADDLGLLVCAGTDYHGPEDGSTHGLCFEMPDARWQTFRDALRLKAATTSTRTAAAYIDARRPRRHFGLHVILPSVLAIGLFLATFWALLIPAFERALLDRKREMIRELTHSAWSILADAERQVGAGRLTRAEAQTEARNRIAALRYGRENKDYFWLQDMQPRMVMHPYRQDLNGQDLTDFQDARGARIFVEFADVVRRHQEGYIDYVWQWPDDPRRLEPKESFVKGFAPWGWVIGTGLYIEDVRHEIARLERGLVHATLVITGIVALLLLHVVRHSRRIDRERLEAADELHATTERYRTLVEAAREGTLLVLDGRCHYANPHLLALLGCTAAELELLSLAEVLPPGDANAAVWRSIEDLPRTPAAATGSMAGELRRRDGGRVACTLGLTRIALGGRHGLVLMAREGGDTRADDLAVLAQRAQERDAMIERLQSALLLQQYGADVLTSEIARAPRVEEVVRWCQRTAITVKALLDNGTHPPNVTNLASAVCDAATERFVQLAIEKLGPPPARFAFLALGSQGRQEQTLVTDQDNAIIYALPEPSDRASETAAYFLEMGRCVCSWLNQAGYPFCRGRFMAQNPVWTRALPAWKTHFSHWAACAEPKELLIFTVFFDFRAVCGDAGLVSELRRHVFAELHEAPAFFPHFARHALTFRPPVMLFGRILMGNARHAAPGTLDLKAAMLPIVAFARLYALRHALAQTNTLERLDALVEAGHLAPASRDEITATYTFLLRLRLQVQTRRRHAGLAPDNLVDLRGLGRADRTLLRQAFAHIRVLQRRISYDFLGGTHG
jgi:PAS domain S-box-containing protein